MEDWEDFVSNGLGGLREREDWIGCEVVHLFLDDQEEYLDAKFGRQFAEIAQGIWHNGF